MRKCWFPSIRLNTYRLWFEKAALYLENPLDPGNQVGGIGGDQTMNLTKWLGRITAGNRKL
jgi:hypothetical protein